MQELARTPNAGPFLGRCCLHTHTHTGAEMPDGYVKVLLGNDFAIFHTCGIHSGMCEIYKEKKNIHHSCLPFRLLAWRQLFSALLALIG